MSNEVKILAFAGSLRHGSFNKKLIKIAVSGAQVAGAQVTLIDLKDFPLPIFDQDVEDQGMPENVKKLRDLFKSHHGLLLACPEYNSSMSGVFKNTIDWVSRPTPTEPDTACFNNKVAAIMSASPSGLGGLRGLVHVRAMLSNMRVLVLPQQVTVSKANEAFNADGSLKDQKQHSSVEQLGKTLADMTKRLI